LFEVERQFADGNPVGWEPNTACGEKSQGRSERETRRTQSADYLQLKFKQKKRVKHEKSKESGTEREVRRHRIIGANVSYERRTFKSKIRPSI